MNKITLHTLHCTVPDEIDMDEVYLKLKGEKIWPTEKYHRLDTGDKINLNVTLENDNEWLEIELWDYDYLSRNDYLGVFKFKNTGQTGKYSTSMQLKEKGSTASYILTWEAL